MSESARRKAVLAGAGLVSLALLATVLVAKGWSDDNGVPHSGTTTWGAPSGGTTRSGPVANPPSSGSPSPASAGEPVEIAHGRLRGLDAGLCVDVRGGRPRAGADLRLGPCSDAGSQQWSYQDDGMLRSALDPTLCLVADPGTRTVVVAGCLVHAGEVSYDLTVRGELLPRWDKGLALAADGTRVVVARRSGSAEQRWELEPGVGGVAVTPRPAHPTAPAPKKGEPAGTPAPPLPVVPQGASGEPQEPYGTRVAQAVSPQRPVVVAPTAPRETVGSLSEAVGDVLDSAPATVTDVLDSVPDAVSGAGGLLG